MSALDLFASALGAFILLTVIALPYFANTHHLDDETLLEIVADLRDKLRQTENQLDAEKAARTEAEAGRAKAEGALAQERKRTTLFGIETSQTRIVMLIDMSGSMNDDQDFRPTMLRAVGQIFDVLQPETELALIGFHAPNGSTSLPAWPAGGFAALGTNRPTLQSQLANMMSNVDGGTPSLAALRAALDRKPGAIIMLTDGAPTEPDTNWQRVVSEITQLNNGATEIHAVAIGPFWQESAFISFLAQLTQGNRGHLSAAIQ